VAAKHPIVTTWQVPRQARWTTESLVTDRGAYLPLRRLGFQSAYPVLQGYKHHPGLGLHAHIDDPLGLATIGVTAAFTPSHDLAGSERGHLDARYSYLGWHAGAAWNNPTSTTSSVPRSAAGAASRWTGATIAR